tara:strand:- start:1182 stop:1814 length:633 start_codon:yes stop_codon:yes gene_type:complete
LDQIYKDMKKFIFQIIFYTLVIMNYNSVLYSEEKNYKIIKLVNDKVITNYDLEKRLKLYSTLNNVNINKENIDILANRILSLMVDEKLQIEHIKLYKVSIEQDQIDEYIKRAYLKENQDINDLIIALEKNAIEIDLLRKKIEIQLGWSTLASKLFYRNSEINKIDLENAITKDPSLSEQNIKNNLLQNQIALRAKKLLRDLRTEANIENR